MNKNNDNKNIIKFSQMKPLQKTIFVGVIVFVAAGLVFMALGMFNVIQVKLSSLISNTIFPIAFFLFAIMIRTDEKLKLISKLMFVISIIALLINSIALITYLNQ
ncbi:MAG: hypothetical protein A2Y17_01315 [Clostridiales bacterium GWF2_38_85]|nr:MAG: hypothetical protein A2Y17_01315 [Clostridiales bacterium GWF2_38_85]HBL85159.1 hypothetical protein [Clostridiales bacterium]